VTLTESLAEVTDIELTAPLEASSGEEYDDELLLQLEACSHQHQQQCDE